jgi:hypothetical protein
MSRFCGFLIPLSAITLLEVQPCLAQIKLPPAQLLQLRSKSAYQASTLQLPALRGSYQVGTTSYYLVDSSRKETYRAEAYDIRTQQPITAPPTTDRRELMIYVWYPAKANSKLDTAPYIDKGFALATAQVFGPAFGVSSNMFVKLITQAVHTNSIKVIRRAIPDFQDIQPEQLPFFTQG